MESDLLELASLDRDGKMAHFFWSSLTVQTLCLIPFPIFLALCTLISNPQSLGCSHLSSKGKSIRNLVVLCFEEKEEGRKISHSPPFFFFFPVLSPCKLCKSKLEKLTIVYGKEDVAWLELAGGSWLWFWFAF